MVNMVCGHGGCDVITQQMLFKCVNCDCDVVGGDGNGESDSKGDKCNGDTDQDGDGVGDGDGNGDVQKPAEGRYKHRVSTRRPRQR